MHWDISDRIRPNLVCRYLLLLLCVSGAVFHETETPLRKDEFDKNSTPVTAVQPYRHPRMYRRGYQEEHDYEHDHHDDHMDDQKEMKAIAHSNVDYWGGYYDFLINEGSYKFWAVFQLATAALLIYSGFAALYYAKVNPPTTDDEFDDIFRRRRRRRALYVSPRDMPFCGLDSATFQRIIDAVSKEVH
ncbi:uncharacterized protein LOC128896057 isoform X1 [Hylaeus anthracinus]|uniref:uncharacterized protein LOC128896057 isoform X1 n=1 Tax=Hylaeus anthracinus TaxID=313031 RepID=UPI0023B8BA2B|nr:uncharacterized protein LOC128896057 isoform X1 [Hylaeus anthracinus]